MYPGPLRRFRNAAGVFLSGLAFVPMIGVEAAWAGGAHGGRVMSGLSGMEQGWISEFYRYQMASTFMYLVVSLFLLLLAGLYLRKKQPQLRLLKGNLLNLAAVRKIVKSRVWPGITQIPAFLVLLYAIGAGFFGTSSPGGNLATVLTWQIWWVLLAFLILFSGRSWCLLCPVGAVADWAKRIYSRDGELPRPLRSLWLQTVSFLILTWAITYWNWKEKPFVTALLLTGLVIVAFLAGIALKGRSFCRYLCPVSGMIGLYSMIAPIELRANEKTVCQAHGHKECISGTYRAKPCPWLVPPPLLEHNSDCNFCLECYRACSLLNVRLGLRPPGQDLWKSRTLKPDEAMQAFVLFGVVFFQTITMLSFWQSFKNDLFAYTLGYAAFSLLLPGVMLLVSGLIAGGFGKTWLGLAGMAAIPSGFALMLVHDLDHLSLGLPDISAVISSFWPVSTALGGSAPSVYSIFSPFAAFWLQLLILLAGFVFVLCLLVRWSRSRFPLRWLAGIGLGSVSFILLSFNVLRLPMSTSVSGSNSTRAGFLLSQKIAFISDRMGWEELFLMNPDGSGLSRLTLRGALEASWSPDGSKLAYVSDRHGNKELYIYSFGTGKEIRLTNNTQDDWAPTWSPDGGRLAFVSGLGNEAEIYLIRPDGSDQIRLTSNNSWDYIRSWSPDGKKILFESNRDGNLAVYVMDDNGANQVRLTRNNSNDADPSYSPDGKKIVFSSDRDGNREIYIMNANGSRQKRLTRNPAWDGHPYFSPEGTRILFESNRGKNGTFEIVVMYINGSRERLLTVNEYDDNHPSWSPDGAKVIFETKRSGKTQIYQVNADGTGEIGLTDSGSNNYHPAW